VAFFGEGAMNQGMLMESMNLASAWNLPVLFVCKDDAWAITTSSRQVTGGLLGERARGLGLAYIDVDGRDVAAVWESARTAMDRARSGQGPAFLHAHCVHLEAHFLGYPLLRIVRDPLHEMPGIAGPLAGSLLHPGGAPWRERLAGLRIVLESLVATLQDQRQDSANDPVVRTRLALPSDAARLEALEKTNTQEIATAATQALAEADAPVGQEGTA